MARKLKVKTATQMRKKLRPTDKWIVGMIDAKGKLCMFNQPPVFESYMDAVADAENRYASYQHASFVVFAKVCVISPSRPPILKTEFST